MMIRKNEVLLRDQEQWLCFSNPHKIIVADSLQEVVPALSELEQLAEENGWYAAGFLSYECASAFDPAFPTKLITGFPYLWFGLYPKPRAVSLRQFPPPRELLNWQPTIGRDSYNDAIVKVKEYIAQGKTYQVNYTMRLQADFNCSFFFNYTATTESQ